MLVEVSKEEYRKYFPTDPNPFISDAFVNLVEEKQDKILRLMNPGDNTLGLIVGLKNGVLRSPFSAPFGGFHYKHEHMFYEVIEEFIQNLKVYIEVNGYHDFYITLPPNIYQENINAKLISAFIRNDFVMKTPDLNNWVNLTKINGEWKGRNVAQNIRKAVKHGLVWKSITEIDEMKEAYKVIHSNREGLGRKIYMTLDDILKVNNVFPVDFFGINDAHGKCVGASVLYRGHDKIVQGIFMGGDLAKRYMGVIDYMYMNLYEHYKKLGYYFLDMGTSSLQGNPNSGLLRFKEIHNSETSLRFTFTLKS